MWPVIHSLLPIVLLVASGTALLKLGFYNNDFRRGLDRLVYWVALPALIVGKLAEGGAVNPDAGWVLVALAGATAGVLGLGYGAAWLMKLPPPATGVLVQAGFRGNLAFVGLPVVVLAAGGHSDLESRAVLVLAPMVLIYNVLAVIVLELGRQRISRTIWRGMAKSLLTNPLLLSCGLGLVIGFIGLQLPSPVQKTLDLAGGTAAPLALLSLGGSLVVYRVRDHLGRALMAGGLKVVAVPALAWLIGTAIGLDAGAMLVLMIFAACPTAVASYVLSVQLEGDEGLAASSIVVSTILSAGALAVALMLTT